MLGKSVAFSGFSVNDMDQAKKFYGDVLGVPVDVQPGMGMQLSFEGGTKVYVYEKPEHTPATFTILNFVVDDIDAAVDELVSKGVELERYEGFEQDEKGIARGKAIGRGPDIAWFKDPAGNILAVLESDKQ